MLLKLGVKHQSNNTCILLILIILEATTKRHRCNRVSFSNKYIFIIRIVYMSSSPVFRLPLWYLQTLLTIDFFLSI